MALEQKLHLKLSQKLIMTPSLQQAIKLLQLSKLELQEVLNQELLENPLLEETAEEAKTEEADAEAQDKTQTEEEAKAAEPQKEKDKDSFDEIDYDAYFQDYIEYGYNPRMTEEHEEFPIENTLTRPPNLTDHLTWQLMMSDASPRIKEIGQFIIGNIDEDGYLRATNEEIMAAGGYEPGEVEQAVRAVQSLRSAWPPATCVNACCCSSISWRWRIPWWRRSSATTGRCSCNGTSCNWPKCCPST
jgi:RNA polymerase sigma-54 factor